MQNNHSFKQRLFKNGYLLITAAWLLTISFIIDNYWSGSASPEAFQKSIGKYIAKQEIDFDAFNQDTAAIQKLANKNYNEILLQRLEAKKYFLFVLSKDSTDKYNLLFWSTQVIDPIAQMYNMQAQSGFIQFPNGYYVWRKHARRSRFF